MWTRGGAGAPMIRATTVVRRLAVKSDQLADTITLDHGDRHRRRITLTGEWGLSFLLDLADATVLDDGDAVRLEDGRLIGIRAAPEKLIEVTTTSPLRLMKIAWHIGNRHIPCEITNDALYIADDHVLMEMVRGLGAHTQIVERPFRPERGAYDHSGHDHGH
jgi:urease accessory protein